MGKGLSKSCGRTEKRPKKRLENGRKIVEKREKRKKAIRGRYNICRYLKTFKGTPKKAVVLQ